MRNAETMQLLDAIGCYPATVRKLGHLAPAFVRDQVEAARRCGRAADLAGFVAFVLENGGVYGASRSGRGRPARDAPVEASSWAGESEPDPREPQRRAMQLPTVCSSCGGWCPPEWEGHCARCEPGFEPGCPLGGGGP